MKAKTTKLLNKHVDIFGIPGVVLFYLPSSKQYAFLLSIYAHVSSFTERTNFWLALPKAESPREDSSNKTALMFTYLSSIQYQS